MTAAPDLEGQWEEAEPGALPSWHTLGYFLTFFIPYGQLPVLSSKPLVNSVLSAQGPQKRAC